MGAPGQGSGWVGGVPRVVTRVVGAVKVSAALWVRAGPGTDLETAAASPHPGKSTSPGPQRLCWVRAAPGPTDAVFTGSAPARTWPPRPTRVSATGGQTGGLQAAALWVGGRARLLLQEFPSEHRRPFPGAGTMAAPPPAPFPPEGLLLPGPLLPGLARNGQYPLGQGLPSPFLPGPA